RHTAPAAGRLTREAWCGPAHLLREPGHDLAFRRRAVVGHIVNAPGHAVPRGQRRPDRRNNIVTVREVEPVVAAPGDFAGAHLLQEMMPARSIDPRQPQDKIPTPDLLRQTLRFEQ